MDPAALLAPLLAAATPTLARAALAGAASDRLGSAFLAGYRAALDALVPGLGGPAALAATEQGPLHPARITTRLVGDRVSGPKSWVTGCPGVTRLVVLATAGEEGGRHRLVAVVVDATGPGVVTTPMPPTPFVPEVPHARLVLDGAPVLRVLPGDGWADVVRPFRTVEDHHVVAATLGLLLARTRPDPGDAAAACAALAALAGSSTGNPSSPAVHLALAGALAALTGLVERARWPDPESSARWARDAPLLSVAGAARTARAELAYRKFWTAHSSPPTSANPQATSS